MTKSGSSDGCQVWQSGNPTKHAPHDTAFLEAVLEAGFSAFTGPGGLFGGEFGNRCVLLIHRGRGVKWEVIFQEYNSDVVTTTTSDLKNMTTTMLSWLRGGALAAEENSIRAVAG